MSHMSNEEKGPKVDTQSYKGVRDFYPEDMAVQNYIFSVWRDVAEEAKEVTRSSTNRCTYSRIKATEKWPFVLR
jgi:hypothetical protein